MDYGTHEDRTRDVGIINQRYLNYYQLVYVPGGLFDLFVENGKSGEEYKGILAFLGSMELNLMILISIEISLYIYLILCN